MTLAIPAVGNTIHASTINQLVNIFQQPAGAQEIRTYHIAGNAYAAGVTISCNVLSRSRGSVPVAVSTDKSGETFLNLNGQNATNLTAGGVQIWATSQGIASTCVGGGNVTFQY